MSLYSFNMVSEGYSILAFRSINSRGYCLTIHEFCSFGLVTLSFVLLVLACFRCHWNMLFVLPKDLQSISIQLDGKNYAYWSYVMKFFLNGKIWVIVIGVKGKLTNDKSSIL